MISQGENRRFVVLGGAGAIGRFVVRDLLESHPQNRVWIADYHESRARAEAAARSRARARAVFADARRPRNLARLFRGAAVVVNCTQHDFNLRVMLAALAAGVHYVDLGGLFVWTRQQLKLHARFRRAGLTAVLGAGCAPGITNLLACHAADQLARVRSIRIRVGSVDFRARPEPFWFPYSAQTIVEEMTLAPWIFSGGRLRPVKPRSGWERTRFPPPVGARWVVRTRHSELATLPRTFRAKGLRFCDFKVHFEKSFVRELMKRLEAGWTIPRLAALPAPRAKPDDCEIARVIVDGIGPDGRSPRTITVDCSARARPEWRAGAGDIDTACPASIVAQMIAGGFISQRGVCPPETVVPTALFFRELNQRGLKVVVRSENGGSRE